MEEDSDRPSQCLMRDVYFNAGLMFMYVITYMRNGFFLSIKEFLEYVLKCTGQKYNKSTFLFCFEW